SKQDNHQAAKVRISEEKPKEKAFFLVLFRARVPSTEPKGTKKKVDFCSKRVLFLSLSSSLPHYSPPHT
ncbi:MAG: hypothetical protein IJT98_10510, partial [Prevotella sp.]|nr:hypothetical protein [Prevotella sp.]